MIKTLDGGYLVGAGNGGTLIKTDSKGNTQWSRAFRYQGAQWSFFHSAVQAREGGYVMSGTAYPVYNGLAWILKVDFNGTIVGEIAISPESGINNRALSIVEASDGGFVFAGTKNAPDGEGNLWLAKVRAEAIPEIPSWLVLPLFFFAISLTALVYWKKRKRQPSVL